MPTPRSSRSLNNGHTKEVIGMDTLSFLTKVLPGTGNYVLTLERNKKFWNENFTTLESLVEGIEKIDKTETTVFFAVGRYQNNTEVLPTGRTKVTRKQTDTAGFKTLCCDLDVGGEHSYADAREAAQALAKFCTDMKMRLPMIVSSGRGLHCYWPLTQELNPEHWTKLSTMLRVAMQDHGIDLDTSKIHDASMVLRPVGAHHKKDPGNWKLVTLKRDCDAADPREYVELLAKYKDVAAATTPAKKKSGKKSEIMDAIMDGTPVDIDAVGKKCPQIAALLESGGATNAAGKPVDNTMWFHAMGMVKKSAPENQKDTLIKLCGKHPDFNLEENLNLLDRWKGTGTTLCVTFEKDCPEGCENCEYRGKLSSPGQLTSGVTEVTMTNPETDTPVTFNLPPRYSIKNGGIFYTPAGADDDIPVSPYMIYVLDRFTDVEEHRQIAKLLVKFPLEGEKVVDLDTLCIAHGGTELAKALALRQIYIPGDVRPLRQYFMTYLQELQKSKPIEMYYRHFGWQTDTQFLGSQGVQGQVEAGALVHYDGPIKDYVKLITKSGDDLDQWVKLTRIFAQPEANFHGLVFLMMAGSPLMRGSGLASTLVNSYSKESGSGKTITARIGLSIWGQPSKLMRTVNDTDNALYKHFGIMHSLGAYIDEITTMDPERLRAFAFTLQEGRERDRVKQSADGFREKVTWQMPLFASSNRDAYEVVGMRYSSEAEKLRILQFTFERLAIFEQKKGLGYEITRFLEANHGFVGPMIIEEIIKRGGPAKIFDTAYKRFDDKYEFHFTGPERFYQAMMVIADAMGEIMEDMGLIHFDYQQSVRNGLAHIQTLRDQTTESSMSGLDLCQQYLTENANKIVHYREFHRGQSVSGKVMEPPPNTAVARTEVAYDNADKLLGGFIYINRTAFRRWCGQNGVEFQSVLSGLKKEGVRIEENVRKTLFKNVLGASSAGQTYCFSMDVTSHPRLIEANLIDVNPYIDVQNRLTAVG